MGNEFLYNNDPSGNNGQNFQNVSVDAKSKGLFYAKTFGYMGLGILITSIVALLSGYLLFDVIFPNVSTDTAAIINVSLNVISVIGLVVASICINVFSLRKGSGLKISYIAYTVIMGLMFGGMALYLFNPYILALALVITSSAFFFTGLFAYLFRNSGKIVMPLLLGCSIALSILVLVNLFAFPFMGGDMTIYWISSGLVFLISILMVAVDVYRLRQVADAHIHDDHIALSFALNLYVDFIYLFLRVLYLLILIFASSKRD